MRTTITLEESLFEALKERAHQRRLPFKRVVNDAIRLGLESEKQPRPYTAPTRALGARVDLTKALQLAGEMEDEEIRRKLELGR